MEIYKCKECGRVFLPCGLLKTKCSENEVAVFQLEACPACANESPPRYSKLEKVIQDG